MITAEVKNFIVRVYLSIWFLYLMMATCKIIYSYIYSSIASIFHFFLIVAYSFWRMFYVIILLSLYVWNTFTNILNWIDQDRV